MITIDDRRNWSLFARINHEFHNNVHPVVHMCKAWIFECASGYEAHKITWKKKRSVCEDEGGGGGELSKWEGLAIVLFAQLYTT